MNKTIVGWLTMLACFAANIVNAVWGLCFITYILLAIVTIGLVITFKMADPDDRKRTGKHVAYVVIAIVVFFALFRFMLALEPYLGY